MNRALRTIRFISKGGGYLAGVLMVGTAALIFAEIVSRLFFGTSTQVAEEFSGYALAGMIYLGAAYTLIHQEHIRVEILRDRLEGDAQVWLERFALTVGVLFGAFLTVAFFGLFWDSLTNSTRSFMPSRTPLAIPHGLIFLGSLLLLLQFVGLLLESWTEQTPTDAPGESVEGI